MIRKILMFLIFVSLLHSWSFSEIPNMIKKDIDSFDNICSLPERESTLELWIPSIITGIVLLLASLILYMLGQVLQAQNIIDMAKDGFIDIMMGIILVAVLLGAYTGVNEAYVGMINVNDPEVGYVDIMDGAINYATFVVQKIGTNLALFMVFNNIIQFYATSTIFFGSFQYQVAISPGLALKPLGDITGLLIQVLTVSMAEWMFHVVSLCVIKQWSWTVLMPFGLLLRIIPYTKDAGGALMAFTLALSLVYPGMFLMNQEVYKLTYEGWNFDSFMDMLADFGIFNLAFFTAAFMIISQSVLVPLVVYTFGNFVFVMGKEAVYFFVLLSLFLPFINIMITLTSAREIAKSFYGVEANFSSIVRII
ncbi:hypothetical protein JXB01_04065 [Candidatus Micrarchaeota archaeon]|nr:hypothetical protein [Candidatus Micrarchaeota archaeon]